MAAHGSLPAQAAEPATRPARPDGKATGGSGGAPRTILRASSSGKPARSAARAFPSGTGFYLSAPGGRVPGEDQLQGIVSRLDRILAGGGLPTAPRSETPSVPAELLDRWRRLCETSGLLNTLRNDFDSVLETVLDTGIELTRAKRGLLFLKNAEGGLDVRLARDHRGRSLDAPSDVPRSIVDRVCESAEPLFLPSIAENLPRGLGASVRDLGLLSAMCVPLTSGAEPPRKDGDPRPTRERRRFAEKARRELLGCIYLDSDANTYAFREEDLYLFLILANHATTALLKERLYREAITDPLTRLFSRGHFERTLQEQARQFRALRAPYALLLVDLDGFKQVNDEHGHQLGDAVLRQVAELLRGTVRQDDPCFRYGGDELAVLLNDAELEGARVVAEKIRQAVAGHRFGEGVRLSVSIGASACPAHATEVEELVRKADQALYRAKQEGRNRVETWSPELGVVAPRDDRLAGIITGDFARDYHNVSVLVGTFDAVSRSHDVHEVLTLAVDKAIEASEAERGAIMLADERGKLSTIVARGRRREPLELKERFSRSIPERVLRSGEPIYLVTADEEFPSQSIQELGLRTVLCAPLVTESGRIGVLYADARKGDQEIREGALPFFAALARHIGLAVENARLRARLHLGR
ncbi:MAG: diguanylate cyclase [Planctomycetota bacterium]|nr:MAG: diguanylate cyclase [Planctomycetota bacterium]